MTLPWIALVKREFLSTLRRGRSIVWLALFVGACIAVVGYTWPEQTYQFAQSGQSAQELLTVIGVTLWLGALLFVPGLAAASIVAERELDTLDQLWMTMIRPLGILFAKLISAVGFYVLLLIAAMPVMGVVFFLVGVDWPTVALLLVGTLSTAITCAFIGLVSSAYARNTLIAVIGAYLGVLALLLGGSFFSTAIRNSLLISWTAGMLPPLAGLTFLWVSCAVLVLRAIRKRRGPRKVRNEKPIDDPAILEARRRQFPFYLIDPLRRKKMVEDGSNPMVVKELRSSVMSRGTIMIRVFYCAFVLYFFVGFFAVFASNEDREAIVNWLVLQMLVTVVFAPGLMANALTKERELGNLDMLRMTLLTPRQIVLGKWFAGAIAVSPLICAAVASCLPALVAIRSDWDVLLSGYITFFVCVLLSLSIGLYASYRTRRTASAVSVSYLFSVALFGGIAFVIEALLNPLVPRPGRQGMTYFLFYYLGYHPFRGNPWTFSGWFSPILAFRRNADPSWENDALINWYWLTSMLASTGLALALMGLSLRGFRRSWMRER